MAVTGETTGRQCWEVQADCCLTTKKQFGQLGDSEQCCGLGKDHLTRAPPRISHTHSLTHTHNTQEYKPGDTKYSAKPANLRLKAPRNLSPKQVTEMEALLGCWNPCNSEAHNSGAARIVMGPYLALLAAQEELRALLAKLSTKRRRRRQAPGARGTWTGRAPAARRSSRWPPPPPSHDACLCWRQMPSGKPFLKARTTAAHAQGDHLPLCQGIRILRNKQQLYM